MILKQYECYNSSQDYDKFTLVGNYPSIDVFLTVQHLQSLLCEYYKICFLNEKALCSPVRPWVKQPPTGRPLWTSTSKKSSLRHHSTSFHDGKTSLLPPMWTRGLSTLPTPKEKNFKVTLIAETAYVGRYPQNVIFEFSFHSNLGLASFHRPPPTPLCCQ